MSSVTSRLASLLGALALAAAACTAPATGSPRGVTVVEIFDGDSFVARSAGREVEVRLLGINAPEHDECFGPEARDRLVALLAGPVELDPVGTDRFGRALARVRAGDMDVGTAQVSEGAALALSGDDPYARDLMARAARAREAGAGMWSPTACGASLPVPEVTISTIEADPPGRDEEHLDDEWVEVTAADPVDLSGWVLRDESSSNRFRFPAGVTLAAGATIRVVTGCRPGPHVLAWCADTPVWNNGGDSVVLLDDRGRVVAFRRYEGS